MYTERVAVERILCNLAHVHLPSALDPVSKDQPPPTLNHTTRLSADNGTTATATTPLPPKNIVSVGGAAKHLCSVGTDLTRKSLSPVSTRIKSCIFATCFHGVCDWGTTSVGTISERFWVLVLVMVVLVLAVKRRPWERG